MVDVGLILYYAVRPYNVPGDLPSEDKIVHAAAFCSFALLATRALYYSIDVPLRLAMGWAIIAGIVIGIAIEVIQKGVPGRSPDLADLLADVAGLGLAVVCTSVGASVVRSYVLRGRRLRATGAIRRSTRSAVARQHEPRDRTYRR